MTALSPSHLDYHSHGPWSLWDIMKSFAPHLFLAQIRMMEALSLNHHGEITADMRAKAQVIFDEISQDCVELNLDASKISAQRILKLLSQADCSYEQLRISVRELQERMIDQMSSPRFFWLSDQEAEYYNSPRKGWDEIISRFPDSIVDIEEAQKCFALSRYSAAVFHSLQVVEIGLIELGRVIVATDPQRGWNATTKRLNVILNTKYPARTPFQQQHQKFLEQIAATIELLKSAWRNKVSHAQDRLVLLRTDFTPAIAEEILVASRSFMRRLATEAPATPDPDA